MEADRQRLARWMAGAETPDAGWIADDRIDALLALARDEGVVCLLEYRLQGLNRALPEGGGERWPALLRDAAREETLRSMMLEGETRRVLAALDAQDIPALLLKGSALAHWAYPQPHLRACGDVDVLVPSREDAERLAAALVGHGYTRTSPSGELVAYELLCTRQITPDWALEVDVHWQQTNSPLFLRAFSFDELMVDAIPLPQLAPNARGLGPVHALLHAAMHRALNLSIGIEDKLKWLYDFVVLTRGFSEADWAPTVELSAEKALAGLTLSALEATAETFALTLPADALMALRKAAQSEPLDATRMADWRYMQVQTARSLPGLRPKMRWLWQRLFPSRDYMTNLYGDQGSYAGLLRERVKRAWRKWRG